MTLKQDRIRIDAYPPSDDRGPAAERLAVADAAILHLARLIGRQIAREQFEKDRPG